MVTLAIGERSMFNKRQNITNGSGEKNAPDNLDTSVSVWQQPGNNTANHSSFSYNTDVSTTYPQGPHQTYDQPVGVEREREDIFHPVKAIEDILSALGKLHSDLELLIKSTVKNDAFLIIPVW